MSRKRVSQMVECEYVFKQGKRKGEKCPRKTKNELSLCSQHNSKRITEAKVRRDNDMKEIRSSPTKHKEYLEKHRKYIEALVQRIGEEEYKKRVKAYGKTKRAKRKGMSKMKQCEHTFKRGKGKGKQCLKKTKSESALCSLHDPEKVEKKKKTIEERLERDADDFFENNSTK